MNDFSVKGTKSKGGKKGHTHPTPFGFSTSYYITYTRVLNYSLAEYDAAAFLEIDFKNVRRLIKICRVSVYFYTRNTQD